MRPSQVLLTMSHENVYFAEKELCTGMLNDRLIDDVIVGQGQLYKTRRGKKRKEEPKVPVATEEVMIFKKGVFTRVRVPVAAAVRATDDDGPRVEGGPASDELDAPQQLPLLAQQPLQVPQPALCASRGISASTLSQAALARAELRETEGSCWGSFFDRFSFRWGYVDDESTVRRSGRIRGARGTPAVPWARRRMGGPRPPKDAPSQSPDHVSVEAREKKRKSTTARAHLLSFDPDG